MTSRIPRDNDARRVSISRWWWLSIRRYAQHPVEPLACAGKPLEKRFAVRIIREDRLARVAARHHVIERAGKLEAKWAEHGPRLRDGMWLVWQYKT